MRQAFGHDFSGLIWNSVEEQFQEKLRSRVPVQQLLLPLNDDAPRTILARLPADWQPPRLDLPVQEGPLFRRAAASARKAKFEWAGDTSRHVGTVVHELLKRNRPALQSPQLASIVKSELLRLGVPVMEEPEASARVLRAFTKLLPLKRPVDPQGPCRRTARGPIPGRIQDRLVSGTIDRVFRDEQNRLWIVDFKIGQHRGGEAGPISRRRAAPLSRTVGELWDAAFAHRRGTDLARPTFRWSMAGGNGRLPKKPWPPGTLESNAYEAHSQRRGRGCALKLSPEILDRGSRRSSRYQRKGAGRLRYCRRCRCVRPHAGGGQAARHGADGRFLHAYSRRSLYVRRYRGRRMLSAMFMRWAAGPLPLSRLSSTRQRATYTTWNEFCRAGQTRYTRPTASFWVATASLRMKSSLAMPSQDSSIHGIF